MQIFTNEIESEFHQEEGSSSEVGRKTCKMKRLNFSLEKGFLIRLSNSNIHILSIFFSHSPSLCLNDFIWFLLSRRTLLSRHGSTDTKQRLWNPCSQWKGKQHVMLNDILYILWEKYKVYRERKSFLRTRKQRF